MVPIPGSTVVAAENRFDSVVHLSVQLAHSDRIGHEDIPVLEGKEFRVDFAILEVDLMVGPTVTVIH